MRYLLSSAFSILTFLISSLYSSCDDNQTEFSNKSYVGIFGSGSFINVYKPSYSFGIAIGTHFYEKFRIEWEINYKQITNRTYNSKLENYFCSSLINLFYEYRSPLLISPYIGIGLGYGYNYVSYKMEQHDDFFLGVISADWKRRKFGMVFQPIIGFRFPIYHRLEGSLDYRYLKFGKNSGDHRFGLGLYFLF